MKNLRNIALLGGVILLNSCMLRDDDPRNYLREKLGSSTTPNPSTTIIPITTPDPAVWARTTIAGTSNSIFRSVAADSAGNVYAVGNQDGTGSYSYGAGVSVAGISIGNNAVLVKYNGSGVAQWAKSTTGGFATYFNSVAVDITGNIYAAGTQTTTTSITYGPGVSVAGTSNNYNIVLVKYNATGVAQWAKSVTAGAGDTIFNSVAVDSSGNVYAAGYQMGTGTYTYGTGISATGPVSGANVALVKYNAAGVAQWAKSVTVGASGSIFNSVAVDSSGNVYAAGQQIGTGAYTYDTGISATGTSSTLNAVLVKYNSGGTAQWAKTVSTGTSDSVFYSLAVDSSGNLSVVGSQDNSGTYTYGTGVSAAGSSNTLNAVLVKYSAAGVAQWAKSVTAIGTNSSVFKSVASDSSGNFYAAGRQSFVNTYTYGMGVSAIGSASGFNIILVKYDGTGVAQWAKSVTAGAGATEFYTVLADSLGNSYAVGSQIGVGAYAYGASVSATGSAGSNNAVIVKYQ